MHVQLNSKCSMGKANILQCPSAATNLPPVSCSLFSESSNNFLFNYWCECVNDVCLQVCKCKCMCILCLLSIAEKPRFLLMPQLHGPLPHFKTDLLLLEARTGSSAGRLSDKWASFGRDSA